MDILSLQLLIIEYYVLTACIRLCLLLFFLEDMTDYVTQCVTSYQTEYVRDHLPCFLAVAWVKLI